MASQTPHAAIIVAAGASRRMGFDKLMVHLAGRPVLTWSLAAVERCPDIAHAVLVCPPRREAEFRDVAREFPKFRTIVRGGKNRAESVLNGLRALSCMALRCVAVHDAARPLVTPELFSEVLAAASTHGAAAAAMPATDSLHRADDHGTLSETIVRENLWTMQTPQAAHFALLSDAVAASLLSPVALTDDVGALIAFGIHPKPVPYRELNSKITFPHDLVVAEAWLAAQQRKLDAADRD